MTEDLSHCSFRILQLQAWPQVSQEVGAGTIVWGPEVVIWSSTLVPTSKKGLRMFMKVQILEACPTQ